jgi:drug/metabolite transporter (DMT)-like permease
MRPAAVIATALALVAFALNSILCRLALAAGAIDAVLFTLVRLGSGAVCLLVILAWRGQARQRPVVDPAGAVMLFVYAIAFSLAYRELSAGVGALILFGMVQATMIGWGLARGERLDRLGWTGLLAALVGLGLLAGGGARGAGGQGSLLMALAGIAWGVYSLRGRVQQAPLAATTGNFTLAVLPAGLALLLLPGDRHGSAWGITLAVLSGALASGLGYVAWYAALPHLRATQAATVQLLVPVIAAGGGVLLLAEAITLRLLAAAVLILGGVRLALLGGRRQHPRRRTGRPD